MKRGLFLMAAALTNLAPLRSALGQPQVEACFKMEGRDAVTLVDVTASIAGDIFFSGVRFAAEYVECWLLSQATRHPNQAAILRESPRRKRSLPSRARLEGGMPSRNTTLSPSGQSWERSSLPATSMRAYLISACELVSMIDEFFDAASRRLGEPEPVDVPLHCELANPRRSAGQWTLVRLTVAGANGVGARNAADTPTTSGAGCAGPHNPVAIALLLCQIEASRGEYAASGGSGWPEAPVPSLREPIESNCTPSWRFHRSMCSVEWMTSRLVPRQEHDAVVCCHKGFLK
ncbi:hypothetical protein [Cupriavidus taiwanensis]|uniref:hypothetical protein n=1 Tax=Cupriavidus taiwanensis TaxID=164546 RepID=UPI0011C066A7|nr:hypothetical protein [Cupriavidus taiwanensis]